MIQSMIQSINHQNQFLPISTFWTEYGWVVANYLVLQRGIETKCFQMVIVFLDCQMVCFLNGI